MKKPTLLLLPLLAGLLLPGARGLADPPGNGWQLAFEDNFDGPGLDTSVWRIDTGARRDARNTSDAIRVENGYLTITTYTEGGKHYTGFIDTRNGFLSPYGYWEARISFQDSPGMWSAFWVQSPTMGNPIGDPATAGAEIDIVEHRAQDSGGRDLRNKAQNTLHWDGYGANHKSVGNLSSNPTGTSLQGNFHTYGLLWTPSRYIYYIDGRQVWTTTQAVSHRSEYLMLTSEVQNRSWAGSVPAGGYGARGVSTTKMVVDWVRTWTRPLYGSDIGSVTLAGSDWLDDQGVWTVLGSGDTWATSDRLHFVSIPLKGDGWITARVLGMDSPDPDAKAGLMFRESPAANAANVMVLMKSGGSIVFQTRRQTGDVTTSNTAFPYMAAPYNLYLERAGDAFAAWGSPDGVNWDLLGSDVIPMAREIYVGLAVTNHHNAQRNTAWFDSLAISGN